MSAKSGSLSIACIQLGLRDVACGVSGIRGCLSIKANERTVSTFKIVRYIGVC